MKKVLLDEKLKYFKANLHCHTTVSDGGKAPEEVKKMYVEQGYSAIAFTDHDVLVPHPELNDDGFIALNGYEMEINEEAAEPAAYKTCHLCFIALSPDNITQHCYHREKYLFCNAPNYRGVIKFDTSKPDYERHYTPECINDIIAENRNNGFFVTYNHPAWSLESYNDYTAYHGMHAMEVVNYSSLEQGFPEHNDKEYDDMLRNGERIFCTATDDNHNYASDSFGSFTMINAEALEYTALTDALVRGSFYASEAPEIYGLVYCDGKIKIKCSPAATIRLSTGVRRAESRYPTADSELTEAEFDVHDTDNYIRITVTDAAGKNAYTSAYFVDELNK